MIEQFHPAEDYENVMRSSDIVVPILIERWHPRSVLDLGCNTGAWKNSFLARGVLVLGVDGSGVGANIECWGIYLCGAGPETYRQHCA